MCAYRMLAKNENALKAPSATRNDLMHPLENIFDDFFNEFFRGTSTLDKIKANAGYPKIDCSSEDNEFVIRAAVPGVRMEDVTVEMLDDQTVEITGKMSQDHQVSDEKYYLRELSKRSFSRRLTIAEKIGDPKSATIKDGILTIRWDRVMEQPEIKRRLIEIKQE